MQQTLRLGVVGAGHIFRTGHAPAWIAHPGVEMVAFCDTDRGRTAELAKQYRVSAMLYATIGRCWRRKTSYRRCLPAPNVHHAQMSIDALRAGKHVFCEKPDAVRPVDPWRGKSTIRRPRDSEDVRGGSLTRSIHLHRISVNYAPCCPRKIEPKYTINLYTINLCTIIHSANFNFAHVHFPIT